MPNLFEFVTLRNEATCGDSLIALAGGNHADMIKTINFYGSAPTYANGGCETAAFYDIDGVFPESVKTVLSNLHRFPSLELLTIEYTFTCADFEGFGLIASREESFIKAKDAEKSEAWRALMAKTYDALAKNKGTYTKGLELRDLIYKRSSTFNNLDFQQFLIHLDSFSLSLCGEGHDATTYNTTTEYVAFGKSLDEFFSFYLHHVTSLTIKASEEVPLGIRDSRNWKQVPLALGYCQMPFLQKVHFEYISICPALIDFLVSHIATLEHISLHYCFACSNGSPRKRYNTYWDKFFDALSNAGFQKLRQIEIESGEIQLPTLYADDGGLEEEEKARFHAIREAYRLTRDPDSGRRLFAYCFLDRFVKMVLESEEENLAAFLRGNDQASYDRLMYQINALNKDEDLDYWQTDLLDII